MRPQEMLRRVKEAVESAHPRGTAARQLSYTLGLAHNPRQQAHARRRGFDEKRPQRVDGTESKAQVCHATRQEHHMSSQSFPRNLENIGVGAHLLDARFNQAEGIKALKEVGTGVDFGRDF